MPTKSMQEILRETPRFSSRAAFFSGRGATTTDLNNEILTHIHAAIKKEHGDAAAQAMVSMVASMESCNATDFINNCYSLEANNFQWKTKKAKKNGIEIEKDSNGSHNFMSAMGNIGEVLFGGSNRIDATPQIRNSFLMKNGVMPAEYAKGNRHINQYGYDTQY